MEGNRLKYAFPANHSVLMRRLALETVLPHLISKAVVSTEENERIGKEQTSATKGDYLLTVVHRRGVNDPEVFDRLLATLKDPDATNGQQLDDVVKRIEEDSRKVDIDKQFEYTTRVMEGRHNAALRKNESAIVNGLDVHEVLPNLIDYGVINLEENAAIRKKRTLSEQARQLVRVLQTKGAFGFKHFVRAFLDSEGYKDLGEMLSEGESYSTEALVKSEPRGPRRGDILPRLGGCQPIGGDGTTEDGKSMSKDREIGENSSVESIKPLDEVDNTPLGEDDLFDVIEELTPITAKWKSIGTGLRLKRGKRDEIGAAHPGKPSQCLSDVVSSWLNKEYDWKRFGEPTWRRVVEVVEYSAAGGSPAIAISIAERHQVRATITDVPAEVQKLQGDEVSGATNTDAPSEENSPQSRAFSQAIPYLNDQLSHSLTSLMGDCFAAGLISYNEMRSFDGVVGVSKDKETYRLLVMVLTKIRSDPSRYNTFKTLGTLKDGAHEGLVRRMAQLLKDERSKNPN